MTCQRRMPLSISAEIDSLHFYIYYFYYIFYFRGVLSLIYSKACCTFKDDKRIQVIRLEMNGIFNVLVVIETSWSLLLVVSTSF